MITKLRYKRIGDKLLLQQKLRVIYWEDKDGNRVCNSDEGVVKVHAEEWQDLEIVND